MAIYRNIQMSFWTDPAVSDDYTPKDKLFYLYLLTNPHTNLCGCYEVSMKQIAYDIGYTVKEIEELIDRAETVHKTIAYSKDTKELLILKWNKYNWTESEKFRKPLLKEIEAVKDENFRSYLMDLFNGIDTVSIPYAYRTDTTVAVTDTVPDTVSDTIDNIVDYLNTKCGTKYKASSESTRRLIKARMSEGYTEDDFRTVIDKKCDEWKGTEQEKFLRPETLFGTKFEGYLNQKINAPPAKKKTTDFKQRSYDYTELNRKLFTRQGGG